jgi:hypothetical protein
MTAESIKTRILARVRKLMKLANDAGATEGERDNAMRMAHATLAKYNLTLSQANAVDDEKRGLLRKEFLGKPWCITIAASIARLYFCEYFYQTVGGNAGPSQTAIHNFVGRESNAVTAAEIAQFVVIAVNQEANRYRRSIGGGYADYRAFAQGASLRIYERCEDIRRKAEKEGVAASSDVEELKELTGPGTALVIASLYKTEEEANEQALEAAGIKLRKGRSQSYDSTRRSHRVAGMEYGNKVSLNRQVK